MRVMFSVGGESPILVSTRKGDFRKRAPIGVYDQGILCDSCERLFSNCDDYAIRVFLKDFHSLFSPQVKNGKVIAYLGAGIDQKLLNQFFVGTLWRASVSTQPFYSRVALGPLEGVAKAAFLGSDSRDLMRFSTALSRWNASPERQGLTLALASPFREKWDGVSAYRFYLGQTVAYIKVDSRPFRMPLNKLVLGASDHVQVVCRDFDGSKDYGALITIVREAERNRRIS